MSPLRLFSQFRTDRRGTSAVEFAWTFPFLLLVLLGAYNVSRAANAARQLSRLSDAMATMLVTNGTGILSYLDLHYAYDSAMVEFPLVLFDSHNLGIAWQNDISISMAGVSFSPTVAGCTTGCAYKTKVVWTGGAMARTCGSTINPAADTAAPSPTTLPTDLFTPIALPSGGYAPPNFQVVVDIVYSWRPLVGAAFIPPITFRRSTYLSPRYVAQINYEALAGDDGFGVACP